MANKVNYKNPPQFEDSMEYEMWKKEGALWKTCCKLEKKEQGPALALSLQGKARMSVLELDVATLNTDDGVSQVIAKLDEIYLKDESQRKYLAMEAYEQYTRSNRGLEMGEPEEKTSQSGIFTSTSLLPRRHIWIVFSKGFLS